jgi:hypothetical protein
MVKKRKFCPKCGAPNNITDAYCIKCGYSFRRGGKKSSSKTIIILIILLAIGWTAYRIFTGKPVIPQNLIDLAKNMTKIK